MPFDKLNVLKREVDPSTKKIELEARMFQRMTGQIENENLKIHLLQYCSRLAFRRSMLNPYRLKYGSMKNSAETRREECKMFAIATHLNRETSQQFCEKMWVSKAVSPRYERCKKHFQDKKVSELQDSHHHEDEELGYEASEHSITV